MTLFYTPNIIEDESRASNAATTDQAAHPPPPSRQQTTATTMSSPLRIAVLECDTPIGRTKEKYGGYGNLFKELLQNGAAEVRDKDGVAVPELDVRKYDVVNEEHFPKIEEVDAVLLSGSRESSPEDFKEMCIRMELKFEG